MADVKPKNSMGVIFDLDGVLVDTGEFHRQSWYALAEEEGFDMSDELFYSTFGMQNYQILPLLAGRQLSAEQIDYLSKSKEQRYRELIADKLVLSQQKTFHFRPADALSWKMRCKGWKLPGQQGWQSWRLLLPGNAQTWQKQI